MTLYMREMAIDGSLTFLIADKEGMLLIGDYLGILKLGLSFRLKDKKF